MHTGKEKTSSPFLKFHQNELTINKEKNYNNLLMCMGRVIGVWLLLTHEVHRIVYSSSWGFVDVGNFKG
jgi:hypothetical protein